MKFAVLGPGGVGGLLAGALWRAGSDVTVIARPHTAQLINERGLTLSSVRLGDFVARPTARAAAVETPDVLIVATKAVGLEEALERVQGMGDPGLVLPLLNGLDHLAVLRRRFEPRSGAGGGHPGGIRSLRARRDRPLEPLPADRHGRPRSLARRRLCRRSATSSSGSGSRCGWATRSPTAPRRR